MGAGFIVAKKISLQFSFTCILNEHLTLGKLVLFYFIIFIRLLVLKVVIS